jgi:hypothetical protein
MLFSRHQNIWFSGAFTIARIPEAVFNRKDAGRCVRMVIAIKKGKEALTLGEEKLSALIFLTKIIFCLTGFRLNENISLEFGYLNKPLQQGRRIDNKTIIQRNNGVVITSVLCL